MGALSDKLLGDNRTKVEGDCVRVIEDEVASKRGATGLAVKAAFKMIKAFKRDIVPDAVHHLLPDFVGQLEPIYDEFSAAGSGDIAGYCAGNGDRIAEALLGITDQRAASSKHGTLVKAYKKLRPQGKKHVVAAMPRIGAMLAANGC